MDGIGNNNFAQSVPSAPPPPPEVKVRTMRSDLAAMAKSGGGLPRFESVKVAGLSYEQEKTGEAAAEVRGRSSAVMVLVGIAAAALLGIFGYLAYRFYFSQSAPAAPLGAPAAPAGGQGTAATAGAAASPSPAAAAPAAAFTHVSLFKKPADQILKLVIASPGAAVSAADLQTFSQKLSAALSGANKNATLIEVDMQTSDGHGVAIGDILAAENAAILDPAFLAAHFNPDATSFVYRDKNGFWPGYILSLKPNENWLFLKNDVAKLESSPDIGNLFLQNIGTHDAGGFIDSAVSGTGVRELPFVGTNISGFFTYGWYQTYLILSTSQGGFGEAMSRL